MESTARADDIGALTSFTIYMTNMATFRVRQSYQGHKVGHAQNI